MKSSNKSSIITGAVLLGLSALFTISLILQLLDFGAGGPGHNNIFYSAGHVLYSVYGFCSILIPLFLFIAGLSCFASKWTSQKTLFLITALIPFFTAVVTEKICRAILDIDSSSTAFVKVGIAVITGLMLLIIEIIGVQYIAEKVNQKLFHSGKRASKTITTTETEETVTEKEEPETSTAPVTPVIPVLNKKAAKDFSVKFIDNTATEEPAESSDVTDEFVEPKKHKFSLKEKFAKKPEPSFTPAKIKKDSIFDKIKASIANKKKAKEDTKSAAEEADEIISKIPVVPASAQTVVKEDSTYINLNMDDIPENEMPSQEDLDIITAKQQLESATYQEPVKEVQKETEEEDIIHSNPASIITQEEYAALINPEPAEEPVDEIEWNNVPPAPAELPPEYTEEIDENDPALEFPPKDPEPVKSIFGNTSKPSPYPTNINLYDESEKEETPAVKPLTPHYTVENYSSSINFEEDTLASAEAKARADQENAISPDFYDVDLNDENLEEELERKQSEENSENDDFDSFIQPDFEEETEEDLELEEDEEEIPTVSAITEVAENPNAKGGATNLTADSLTDFFNAQQIENTPKTQTIQANPVPETNRAVKKGPYVIPSDLLTAYEGNQYWIIDDKTKQAALNLKQTLSEFNIDAEIIGIKKGPVVTMFELLPAPGVKLSKIVTLQDNIALSLAASSVRIVAPIPGKQAVGIEVPNKERSIVGFREIIEMQLPEYEKMAVPVVLGKDILGKAQLIDLVKTPHMLIAGATGSGKSVCVNSLILSILFKRSYKDVKLILVDPKVVELKLYNNIPHLLTPVITEPKKAIQALQYCLCEMERRYALLDGMGVRDISNYNQKIREQKIATEKLPYIVVIIDEFADLMATSGKELESIVARLTAMSRAVGIHLVLATQRPSVNVITGLIKANIPTRIAFMVASRTDSNIIIDSVGAEKLLGRGDMLYASAVDPYPVRIQGTFVSDQEVEDVVNAVKEYGEPDYIDDEIFVEDDDDTIGSDLFGNPMSDEDPLYDQALEIVVQAGKASASYIQRRLKIGYNRAARLVEEMEERGIVGPANGSKPREIIHIP